MRKEADRVAVPPLGHGVLHAGKGRVEALRTEEGNGNCQVIDNMQYGCYVR